MQEPNTQIICEAYTEVKNRAMMADLQQASQGQESTTAYLGLAAECLASKCLMNIFEKVSEFLATGHLLFSN